MVVDYDKVCFVIMPFGEEGTPERDDCDDTYHNIIKEAVKRAGGGLKCKRADDINLPGSVIGDIILDLEASKYVIADLSGPNANVMYELGIRHSHRNSTILMATTGTKLPFDTGFERTIFYRKDTQESREAAIEKVKTYLVEMQAMPERMDSPVLRTLAPERQARRESGRASDTSQLSIDIRRESSGRLDRLIGDVPDDKFILDVGMLPVRPSKELVEYSAFRQIVDSLFTDFRSTHSNWIISAYQEPPKHYDGGLTVSVEDRDIRVAFDFNWYGSYRVRFVSPKRGEPPKFLNLDIMGIYLFTGLTLGVNFLLKVGFKEPLLVYSALLNTADTGIWPRITSAPMYRLDASTPMQENSISFSQSYVSINHEANYIEDFFSKFCSKLGFLYGMSQDTNQLGSLVYSHAEAEYIK